MKPPYRLIVFAIAMLALIFSSVYYGKKNKPRKKVYEASLISEQLNK